MANGRAWSEELFPCPILPAKSLVSPRESLHPLERMLAQAQHRPHTQDIDPTLLDVGSEDYSSQACQLLRAASFVPTEPIKKIYICVSTMSFLPPSPPLTLYFPLAKE